MYLLFMDYTHLKKYYHYCIYWITNLPKCFLLHDVLNTVFLPNLNLIYPPGKPGLL